MNEANEITNLVFSLGFFFILLRLSYKKKLSLPLLTVLGIVFILLGNIFTVIEEYAYPEALNILEHLTFAVGTFLFFLGAIKPYRTHG